MMTTSTSRRARIVTVALALGVGGALAGVHPATASSRPTSRASWPYSNGDLANTRDAAGSTITAANVSTLRERWSFSLTGKAKKNVGGYGTLAATPIVVNGVVYVQDLHSNVYALSLATGNLEWSYLVNKKETSGPGPNGVAVVDGKVYGATPRTVFALNANTGHSIWSNDKLLKKDQGTFGIQPQVANGRVYLASQYGLVPGGGVVFALNAATGALLWTFKTVPKGDKGVIAVGLGAGGAWETPLVSADGSVTFGIGNPYQSLASALTDPSALLYTDSDVNLNAATGKLRWYYQGVTNDFKDYDMQASPISANANGVPVVIGGGKMGIVYEINASTGKLIWKTPVGTHNGHDDDSLKALKGKSKLSVPFTYIPGALGGILTNMAVAGNTVYVVTCNFAFSFSKTDQVVGVNVGKKLSGDVEALNLVTGKVEWETKVNGLPLGAATVSNNLVFTTLFQGELLALNRSNGAIVYKRQLPRSTNSPIAIAGNTVIVPAGGPKYGAGKGASQIVAYTLAPT
ncbi:MAG TPA: PQQ-binding-like beta-propeller repeat protein [Acidimicrobiales bacterium]|nr:PQQ-binding-like beta-propeller repeat protein [Acidimicrobiales bacterium]